MSRQALRLTLVLLVGSFLALAFALGVTGAADIVSNRSAATVRYVTPGGNCGGPSPCYATIQAAVDAAGADDEIRVAAGIYSGVSARSGITQVVYLDKALTLRGGYTIANWNVSDPAANPTTIDAQGLGRGLVISGTQAATIVDGLGITGGNATGLGGYPGNRDAGGGAFVFLAVAELRNGAFYSNTASTSAAVRGYGGGLAAIYSTLALTNSTLENNRASTANRGYGGGLFVLNFPGWGGPITLTSNAFRTNVASTANTGSGGGIYLDTCTAMLTGNTLLDNVATSAADAFGYGGGMEANESELTLADNTVQGNRAGAGGSGGGLYFYDVNAALTSNLIAGNTAGAGKTGSGGGLYASSDLTARVAEIVLAGNTIRDNLACRNDGPTIGLCRGGGMRLSRVKATLTGNTVQGNTAVIGSLINDNGRGGGLSFDEPFTTTLSGNTIRQNVASTGGFGFGGGIEALALVPRPGGVLLTGNTVQSNTASLGFTGYGGGVYLSNITATLGSNVLAGNAASKAKDGYGGGFYAEGGSAMLDQNTVETNIASTADRGVGGGLSFGNVTYTRTIATLTGNLVAGNIASTAITNTSTWRSGAGGLDLWLTSGTVSSNTFTGNVGGAAQAAYCGGVAIHTGAGAAVVFNANAVRDNVASAVAGGGGGGLCISGAVTASGNAIQDNRASAIGSGNGGGVMIGSGPRGTQVGGAVSLTDNAVLGNVAATSGPGVGGGIYVWRNMDGMNDVFTITLNLIVSNTATLSGAGQGGGVYLGPSHQARLDANTIIGNIASGSVVTTALGGGLAIAGSYGFSLTNNVIARNQAAGQGSGLWLGKQPYIFSTYPTAGVFLHTTIADNQGGAGVWLDQPLPAGALTQPYAGGTILSVQVTGYFRVGDTILVRHASGSPQEWRRVIALQSGSTTQLTLDAPLANAYPLGSLAKDAPTLFANTIVAEQTVGIGTQDQPVTLENTLWYGNGTDTTDNWNAIRRFADVTGAPAFVGPTAGDYHIGGASAAKDRGPDVGVRRDMDGDLRPQGAGYDLGADEYTGQATRTPTPSATATASPTGTATSTPTATSTIAAPTATSTRLVSTPTPTATRVTAQRVYVPLLLRRQ